MSRARTPDEELDDRIEQYRDVADEIRKDIVEMCYAAQSGHLGGSLSAVEYLLWLYNEELDVSPDSLQDPTRDRLVYSKGHACPVLYAVLARYGFVDTDLNQGFRRFEGGLPGHSSPKVPGVEFPSGSLGQGLSFANGIALAGDFDDLAYKVYPVLGDGELQEGNIWEAAMAAGDRNLGSITAVVDRNRKQNDLPVSETQEIEPLREKFESFNWNVWECDGHDFRSLAETFADVRADTSGKPSVVIANTIKGKGISYMEESPHGYHAGGLSDEEYERALQELGFDTGTVSPR